MAYQFCALSYKFAEEGRFSPEERERENETRKYKLLA